MPMGKKTKYVNGMPTRDAITDKACKLMDHDRVQKTDVLVPIMREGKPAIHCVASVFVVYPVKGHGERPLYVSVYDHGNQGGVWGCDSATGYGYDKLTAALTGLTIGGFELGNHCDSKKRPTLRVLCDREGWTLAGGHIG